MRLLLFSLLLCAGGAFAQAPPVDDARLDKIEAAWRAWYASHRVGNSALAVAQGGQVARDVMRGGEAGEPAPLASLSKAITGACVQALASEGLLRFDDPVGGTDIAALLTHRSGVWPDSTQKSMWDWVNDPVNRHSDVTETALSRPLTQARAYRYNNENYAILGQVIEEATGQPYEEACAARVLAPLGLNSARRSPRYGAFLTWGGWEMSAADYARFVDATFAEAPDALPQAPMGRGVRYGLGAMFFEAEGQRITWHTGLLCFGSIDGAGAYFVRLDPGYSVVVTFEGCGGEEALADLDQALLTAMLR